VTEAHACEQVAEGRYLEADQERFEPATFWVESERSILLRHTAGHTACHLGMYRVRQLYKNISMLFLFPVKDGRLSTGVNATFDASCYS